MPNTTLMHVHASSLIIGSNIAAYSTEHSLKGFVDHFKLIAAVTEHRSPGTLVTVVSESLTVLL